MYDRLLRLLSETGETEEHKEVKRKVAAKKKKTVQNFLFGEQPNPRSKGDHPGDDVAQGKNKGRQGP
jgi:hypothetical protein